MLFISEKTAVQRCLDFAQGTKFAVEKMVPDSLIAGYVDDTVELLKTVHGERERETGMRELKGWIRALKRSAYVPAQQFAQRLEAILEEEGR